MNTKRITHIDLFSTAYVFAGFGFLTGLIKIIYTIVVVNFLKESSNLEKESLVLGFLLIPLISAITGYITGVIIALFYNLISRFIGGIKIKLK